MQKVWIMIDMEDDIFQEQPTQEVARILRALANRIDGHPNFSAGHFQPLTDINGNNVGWVSVEDKELILREYTRF